MIQANELRIGNKLEFFNLFQPKDIVTVTGRFMLGFDEKDLNVSNYYRPIPLTPEILEKCNNIDFRIDTSSGLTLMVKDGKLVWFDSEWNEETPVENVTYVHQFQNLYFALTGKEIEINL